MKLLCSALLAAFVLTGKTSFIAAGSGQRNTLKPGTERWSIKTGVVPGKARVVSWDMLAALEDPPGVRKNDSRYQHTRIPGSPHSRKLKEGDIISVTCWLHLVATDPDGDYHIQVSNDSINGDQCVIVEVPRPEPEFVSSDSLRPVFAKVREWIRTKLLRGGGNEPSTSGNVMTHTPHVVVTGQLFYDDSHFGDPPRGKRNMKAVTLWEIHPVTAISFAPKSRIHNP